MTRLVDLVLFRVPKIDVCSDELILILIGRSGSQWLGHAGSSVEEGTEMDCATSFQKQSQRH